MCNVFQLDSHSSGPFRHSKSTHSFPRCCTRSRGAPRVPGMPPGSTMYSSRPSSLMSPAQTAPSLLKVLETVFFLGGVSGSPNLRYFRLLNGPKVFDGRSGTADEESHRQD